MQKEIRRFSQELRKNATKEERHLWYDFLKDHPVPFRRQVPFAHYIVDFYCAEAKLVIELDGSQHYSEDGAEQDRLRTEFLQKNYGLSILRFTNLEINCQFEGVCTAINEALRSGSPSSASCGGTFPLSGEGLIIWRTP